MIRFYQECYCWSYNLIIPANCSLVTVVKPTTSLSLNLAQTGGNQVRLVALSDLLLEGPLVTPYNTQLKLTKYKALLKENKSLFLWLNF